MPDNFNQHIEMFKLLTHEEDGALSTISVDVAGYPFGSVTPYCLDANFIPNILISTIAQHTRNISANNKVSLMISQRTSTSNKQALGRLTYIGNAVKVEDDDAIKKRYLSYFPQAKDYFLTHGFSFYKIMPVKIRFIGGFGKIYWIEKESLDIKNIFTSEDEAKIVKHMNEDHGKNLKDYSRFYLNHECKESDNINMCGLDQYGVDLSLNGIKYRIDFKQVLTEVSQARSVFVKMADEARG